MTLNCYVIDDEPHAIKILTRHIENTPELALAGSETNSVTAWNKMVNKIVAPDLLFLDVDMPQISGIELAGLVKTMTTVIFTTAHPEYGWKAYENDAIDYLMKPVTYQRFLRSVAKARAVIAGCPAAVYTLEDTFCVKSAVKGKLVVLKFDEVIYIQGRSNFIMIHGSAEEHLVFFSLRELEEQLPKGKFIRIHKSFIVNSKKIAALENGKVIMNDGKKIDIGPNYKNSLLAFFNTILISKRP